MKILVPLDGSTNSNKALLHACELAKTFDAKIHLIYVIEKTISLNLLDRKAYLTILKNFGSKVIQKGEQVCVSNGLDPKSIIKEGNIANEIIKYAKNENCNLIVMGNKGLGLTGRLLLGSVSSKLVNNSPCSLLIVK